MHIVAYISALARDYQALLSCFVFTLLSFFAAWKNKSPSWQSKAMLILALGSFLYASEETWGDQYARTQPGLSLDTHESLSTSLTPNGIAAVNITASLKNNGAPSIVDHWMLEMKSPNGMTRTALTARIREDQPISFTDTQGHEFLESPADALYRKTSSDPIPNGWQVTGELTFLFPNIDRSDLQIRGTVYRLTCRDIFGNEIPTTYVMKGGHFPGHPVFPGMKSLKRD